MLKRITFDRMELRFPYPPAKSSENTLMAISGTDWLEVPIIYVWPIFQA